MKSEHRHELETNVLAQHLGDFIERVKPYLTTICTVLLVTVAALMALGYVQKSTAARKSEAWDEYNRAIEGRRPDLDSLKQSSEQYAGTKMAQLSEITWADGKLWEATMQYVNFRTAANDALRDAENAYLNLARSATDPRIRNRAHFGLGRVYEMRSELKKARDHYSKVEGAFAELAAARAEALTEERTIEDIEWLAAATPPARRSPVGPGTPGEKPEFDVDELGIFGEEQMFGEESTERPQVGDLFEALGGTDSDTSEDRYSIDAPEDTPDQAIAPTANDDDAQENETEVDGADEVAPADEPTASSDTAPPSPSESDSQDSDPDSTKEEASADEQPNEAAEEVSPSP